MALARAGADLDKRNKKLHTASMVAAFKGLRDVLEALVEAGCDLSLVDDEGLGAAEHARQKGFEDCAMYLDAEREKRALEGWVARGSSSERHARSV
jgi:ankyrin repeat protein